MHGSTQPSGDELDEFDAGSAWLAMKAYRLDLETFVVEHRAQQKPDQ